MKERINAETDQELLEELMQVQRDEIESEKELELWRQRKTFVLADIAAYRIRRGLKAILID